MKYLNTLLLSTGIALTLLGCKDAGEPSNSLSSDILSASGGRLGSVTLTDLGSEGTEVLVKVSGISEGTHAMHFHEIGKCAPPDFKSSGGHFNPAATSHGHNTPGGPHAGDMMNVEVNADQSGTFKVVNPRVTINPKSSLPSLLDTDGTALVLHAKADDYESQPSGAAGARIGCAVIGSR